MCLVFAQKQLPFTSSLDHVEAFAGDQSVTLGELEVRKPDIKGFVYDMFLLNTDCEIKIGVHHLNHMLKR